MNYINQIIYSILLIPPLMLLVNHDNQNIIVKLLNDTINGYNNNNNNENENENDTATTATTTATATTTTTVMILIGIRYN